MQNRHHRELKRQLKVRQLRPCRSARCEYGRQPSLSAFDAVRGGEGFKSSFRPVVTPCSPRAVPFIMTRPFSQTTHAHSQFTHK
jgi:hypothetical protein